MTGADGSPELTELRTVIAQLADRSPSHRSRSHLFDAELALDDNGLDPSRPATATTPLGPRPRSAHELFVAAEDLLDQLLDHGSDGVALAACRHHLTLAQQ